MVMRDKLNKALANVFKKIDSLSDEEFRAKLEEHQSGNFASILFETGALECMDFYEIGYQIFQYPSETNSISFKIESNIDRGDCCEWRTIKFKQLGFEEINCKIESALPKNSINNYFEGMTFFTKGNTHRSFVRDYAVDETSFIGVKILDASDDYCEYSLAA